MARSGLILGLILAVVALWALVRVSAREETLGPAPDIGIKSDGKTVRLSDLKGKVVLIDFWATWCGPCRQSIPAIEQLYKKYQEKGFEVMGVALEETDEVVPGFVRTMGMTYRVGLPTSRQAVASYVTGSIPLMVLVDKRGELRLRQEGYGPAVDQELAGKIDQLLNE